MRVVQFPTKPLVDNVQRKLNEIFAKMTEMGMTPEEQTQWFMDTIKGMGLVQIDGVWQEPK